MNGGGRPLLRRWVLACAGAEAIGMTAAAGAAVTARAVVGEPVGAAAVTVALSLVVAGGLIEGLAVGSAQVWAFRRTHASLRRAAYIWATVLVAGLGWSIASAPSALAGPSAGPEPPQALVVLGGAGIGLVMGPVLGGAQAWALSATVAHPGRWVVANTVAWVPAMAVIFAGATTPTADWAWWQTMLLGPVTGALAGGVLGAVLSFWVPRLGVSAAPAADRAGRRAGAPGQ